MKRLIKTIISLLIVSVLLLSCVSCGSSTDSAHLDTNIPDKTSFEKVQKKLNDYFDKYYKDTFNGSMLISSHGKILLSKGFGIANYEKGISNTQDTPFNIGSLTNQFTGMGIMILCNRGLLNVKDTIGKYIPGVDHRDEITVHQLLTQTSGIDDSIYENGALSNISGRLTSQEIMKTLEGKKIKLAAKPGESFYYCDANYFLLGYIIEKVSGKSYEDFINQNIFKPLDMNNSGYYHENIQNDNLAVSYLIRGPEPVKADIKDIEHAYAAGSLYSSVEDLYKWDQALYTDKLIKKQTLDKIFARNTNSYGYGWYISDDKDCVIAQLESFTNGANAFIIRYVGKNQMIVLLSNLEGGIGGSPIPFIEDVLKELE